MAARRPSLALLFAAAVLLAAVGAAADTIEAWAKLCASGSATPAKFKGKILNAEGKVAGNIQLCWASPGAASVTFDIYAKIKLSRVRALSAVVLVAGPLNTTVDLAATVPAIDVTSLSAQLEITAPGDALLLKNALCSDLLSVGLRSGGALQAASSVSLSSGSCA
ncbi:hypothetical protein Rsub_02329 [Raphidocelis subcapitata]|uniref:Uncharacterized protein n=1 Tax=Raphidocelis subcapitata TaxID=307507 RepID=A0A2V0NPQ2_9CHLO|nr:hypothetical protein Rsub_02329 [Raphidocelis subcapitata]|eukprot:GBF89611.1 hypothetical protein Rsub_02329 [Raphidocelis subcapitata]